MNIRKWYTTICNYTLETGKLMSSFLALSESHSCQEPNPMLFYLTAPSGAVVYWGGLRKYLQLPSGAKHSYVIHISLVQLVSQDVYSVPHLANPTECNYSGRH